MMNVATLAEIGAANHGWLDAHHHFSFAGYRDYARMGFGPLRVWNDDLIKAGTGFPMHPHEDMEIITYVRTGAISHEDSLGNAGRTVAGDVQVMSAGTGIVHSEYNLEDEDTTLFQIWIQPDTKGLSPRWESREFPQVAHDAELTILASGRSAHQDMDALKIHQDAALFGTRLHKGQSVSHKLEQGRGGYLVPATGRVTVNGQQIDERSGVAVYEEDAIHVTADTDVEIVIVDVPFPWHPHETFQ